jgi:predicted phage terminase large subunit-like protein
VNVLSWDKENVLLCYCEPSVFDAVHNDFKAIVLGSMMGDKVVVLDMWCRVASVQAMVNAHYDMHARWGFAPVHWMEANFFQDMILKEYQASESLRGYTLPMRGDKRKKDNKEQRIESISGLFERGNILFNEALLGSIDYTNFMNQLLAFPNGKHDDGPDALEGVIWMLQRRVGATHFAPRMGTYKRNSNRRG